MNIYFVPAKAVDAAAISALRQRIWNTTYRDIYPDAVIDDFDFDWHQQRDLKKISDPSFTIYLIRYGSEDIGYFIFRHDGSGVWLHSLYLTSNHLFLKRYLMNCLAAKYEKSVFSLLMLALLGILQFLVESSGLI